MTFIGSLNQFNAIANLTLSQHFVEKKKKEKMHLLSPTRQQNDRKVNRSKIKQKWAKKREFREKKYKRLLPMNKRKVFKVFFYFNTMFVIKWITGNTYFYFRVVYLFICMNWLQFIRQCINVEFLSIQLWHYLQLYLLGPIHIFHDYYYMYVPF